MEPMESARVWTAGVVLIVIIVCQREEEERGRGRGKVERREGEEGGGGGGGRERRVGRREGTERLTNIPFRDQQRDNAIRAQHSTSEDE